MSKKTIIVSLLCHALFVSICFASVGVETAELGKNIIKKKAFDLGDPVSAANGAYRFDMPLLNPGGLQDLRFTIYFDQNSQKFISAGNIAGSNHFWWAPNMYVIAADSVSRDFILKDGDRVSFVKSGSNLVLNEDSSYFPKNGAPIRYQANETANYFYFLDPLNQTVYIFSSTVCGEYGESRYPIRYAIDKNGNTLNYEYDTVNTCRLKRISDGMGRYLDFTFSTVNYMSDILTSVVDNGGRSVTLTYESNPTDNVGNACLRSVKDSTNDTYTFAYQKVADPTVYDPPLPFTIEFGGFVSSIKKPAGNIPYTNTYAYKSLTLPGYDVIEAIRVVKQTDAYGNELLIDYGTTSYTSTASNPDGSTQVFKHNSAQGPPEELTDNAGEKALVTSNDKNQITSFTDRTGGTTSFGAHSETGLVQSITDSMNGVSSITFITQSRTITNPANGETVTFNFYLPSTMTHPDGSSESAMYDAKGNMLTRTDRMGGIRTYTYNSRGQVLTVLNPNGGRITYTYNADGTMASANDSDTANKNYSYDAAKRISKITFADNTFIQYAYNSKNQITSITDRAGNITQNSYDANGNLTKIRDALTGETNYLYDLMDRLVQTTDPLGKTQVKTYDAMSRIKTRTDPDNITQTILYDLLGRATGLTVNNKTIRTEYSKEGIVTGITTPSGFKTLFLSDAMGQAIGYSDPLNNTTSFKRDTNGLISSVTDPLNRITSFLHNYHNQLTGVTLPGQTATQYNYNPVGNLTSLTDLLGSIWQFTYSPMGRQLSQKDPLNKTISYSYDTLGRLSTASYPDGVVKTMLYDANGNNTAINYSSGLSITSAYDPLNRLTSTNSINFGYNARGQITTSAQHSKNFAAAYTDGGRLANVAYNDSAFTVSYTYDSSGLLSKVSDNLGNFINIGYDNDNRLITTKRSNGVNLQNSYDNAGRITRMVDGAIIDIALTFDTAGQITQKSEIMPLNPADYLTGGELKLTFDAASQINSSGYVYDNRGRLTTAPGKSLSWDADGGLTGINSILYEYNGLKNLIKRTSGGVSTLYSYHHAIGNAPLVAEFNGGGQALKYYVYTPGGALLYMVNAANGDVSFYHFDQTGNTLALTNAQGALTDSYAYTPQGKLLAHSGSVSQPFTFSGATGVIQEPEHQDIYNHRVRWYDAGIGRFLSREQLWPLIEKPEMINPYQYALNNPVSFIDPGGTEPKLYSNSHFNQLGSRGNPLSPMYYDMPDAPIVTAKLAARAAASKKFTFVFKNRKEAALKVAKLVRKGILPPLNKGDKGIPIISTNKPIENFNYDKEHAEAENELDKLRKSIEDRSNSWTGFLTGNLYNDVGIDCIKLRQMASFDAIPKYFRNSSEWSVRVEADTAEFSGFDTSYDGIADVEIEIRFPETGFTDLRSEEMTAF